MSTAFRRKVVAAALGATILATAVAGVAFATHSWGLYHWARTASSFTLKLGDNVSSAWDAYLAEASSDWSQSSVLDTAIVAGQAGNPRTCRATTGRVEVCNAKYGNNGWLGIAQIWINSSNHITKGVAKMNDTYFTTPSYNTPAWRRLVMCQEVAHDFGLSHQDENFSNANLGSCMDYTNDPDGGAGGASSNDPSNEHPNVHDYEQLELIYAHLDGSTTVDLSAVQAAKARAEAARAAAEEARAAATDGDFTNSAEWGRLTRRDGNGRPALYERDLGRGEKLVTHVFWTDEETHDHAE